MSDARKTKAELLEEIARLRAMQENPSLAVLMNEVALPYQSLDGEARILDVNTAWLELFGYAREEVLGRPVSDFLTLNSAKLLENRFCSFLDQGEVKQVEFTMIHRDGRRLLISVNGRIGYDVQGKFRQMHCMLSDITESRRAEALLASSEKQFRGLFESSIDGIVYTDLFGTILNVNPVFCSMLGMAQDDLLGRHVRDITPAEWQAVEHDVYLGQVVKHGFCDVFEKEFFHADGHRVPVAVRLWRNAIASEMRVGVWGIVRDLRWQRAAEATAIRSEQKYRFLAENTEDVIWTLDENFKYTYVSPSIFRLRGYTVEEVLLQSIESSMTPESYRKVVKEYGKFSRIPPEEKKDFLIRLELELYRKDGSTIWGESVTRPLFAEDGRLEGYIGSTRDISDRVQAQQRLRDGEQAQRILLNATDDAIILFDRNGKVLVANEGAAASMGTDAESLKGKNIIDYLPPEVLAGRVEAIEKTLGTGLPQYVKDIAKGRNVHSVVYPVFDDSGEVSRIAVYAKDVTESIQAEEELRLTQFSVDNAPVDIFWMNETGRFIYVNDNACSSLGYERDELLQMGVADINPYPPPEGWDAYWRSRGRSASNRFEAIHRRKDGSEFPVGLTSHYKEYGGRKYFFSYAYNLIERENAEEALRRSQELLNEVQRISRTGGWELDMATERFNLTYGLHQLLGTDEKSGPATFHDFFGNYVHPADRARLARNLSILISRQIPMEQEFRVIKADGSEAVFVVMSIPEMDEQGMVTRLYGSVRDVTQSRETARALQQSHERMLTILDGIDADIYVSEFEDNEVLFINAHMRESFGAPSAGFKCHEIFRGEPGMCPFCPKPSLLDEAGNPVETVVKERFNPLTNRWYLNHDRAIEWLEGRRVHMHMAADITDLKNMEKSLKMAMGEAEAANLAKSEFLANMSHEIRTPLNGLLGMLQLLQFTGLLDEQREYLDIAVDSGRNLLQILNDILDLSKIESGKLEIEEQEMELGEILDSVVSVFQHQAELRGLHMSWTIDESLPRHFLADKGRIRQILFNLVGNACKFSDSGSIIVEAYPLSKSLHDGRTLLYFAVTDTGIGIPEDKIEQVFDPFTQADGSFTRKYQGTGLGLGIVRRLVKLMGGHISVASEVGQGTTIAFTIVVRSAKQTVPYVIQQGQDQGERLLSLLVVEDESVNRIVAQRLLGKLGHDVVCVESGEIALEILEMRQFDSILMDIQMPGMNGLETTQAIRSSLKSDIPIIALTAHAMEGDRERFLEAGMDGYVVKPFDMTELVAELERVLAAAER